MSHHIDNTATEPADVTVPTLRSLARLFGRKTGQRRPVSIETDARLRTSHVRSAAFRPELY